ncbi:MAG: hypothetical protein V1645_00170 [archaeon]
MNLDDMFKGEEGHWDFEVLEAAFKWKLETNELFYVYHHIANCQECYDNFSVVMIADAIDRHPYIRVEVPEGLYDRLATYIDAKP